jgi:hypothetical protein
VKVGDLVKLYGGPDWLQGILKPPNKKGIVVGAVSGPRGDQGYHVKWFDGTEGWVYPRDVEVISGTD